MEPCILGCRLHEKHLKTYHTDDTDLALDLHRVLHHRCDKEWSYHKPFYRSWSLSYFWELKLFINFFDVLCKSVLRNIIIVKSFYKNNWLLRIECIIKTLHVVTKFGGDMFLILLDVALLWV